MTPRQLKLRYFLLEALNSWATTYYLFYLFFFMAREFGFRNQENLFLAATNGLVYMASAWMGGRAGQRFGYYAALTWGFSAMAAALSIGLFAGSAPLHVGVMVGYTLGLGFTWPNLEALVSEKETPYALARIVGIYNMIWAAMGSVAFFLGGVVLETLGRGSMFWLPMLVHVAQLGLVFWLKRQPVDGGGMSRGLPEVATPSLNPRPIARARMFLRMAWFANPFAYIAANTVVAVVPGLAQKFQLSPMLAGFFCSVWMFARLGTFCVLWLWNGWHYRVRWFLGAYALLIGGFATLLLGTSLWAVVLAQVGFGMALGLIYYSSLFYSMDVGETKGEHGGIHETAIGFGIFAGPAIGGTTLYLFPQHPNSGVVAVTGVLVVGLAVLAAFLLRMRANLRPQR